MFYQNDGAWFQWNIYSRAHFWKFLPPSNLHAWLHHLLKREIFKNDMQYENYNERVFFCFLLLFFLFLFFVFLQKLVSWCGNLGTSRSFFASKIDLFPAIVTNFNCCLRKLHLRCDRMPGHALIRTTSLGKIAWTYSITLSFVSGGLVVIFVGS